MNLIDFIEVSIRIMICHILEKNYQKDFFQKYFFCSGFTVQMVSRISREKWVNFSRISREMKNGRNVHLYL